jgi:hypothetical protein
MNDETTEQPTIVSGGPPVPDGLVDSPPLGGDDDWPTSVPRRGIRLGFPAAALIALLVAAAGFWGGAALQKSHGTSSSSAASGLAARFRGAAAPGATGAGPGAGFGGGAAGTTGTISVVDGKTLYVLTSTGSLVKVTLGASTAVTRNAKTAAADLRPGDTVVVQGATRAGGNVSATSVAATAPGVASTAGGGFGGGATSQTNQGSAGG